MKTVAASALALLLAGAAHAQTGSPQTPPPAPAGSSLTRDLNAGPPTPAAYLAPPPAPAASAEPGPEAAPAAPVAPPVAAPRATPAPPPRPAPIPAPVAPPESQPPRLAPIPTTPAPQPRMVPITPARAAPTPLPPAAEPFTPPGAAAAPAPTVPLETVEAVEPSPPPAPPVLTVLDAAARGALPFSVDLPPGFEIVTGRPGPDFRIYTIRRGDRSFAMIYAGPASQFPIYSGQMVEAGGRASVVSTEDGVRHAQEHLFQRPTAPREIHVWTMSLDGADRALAERIAQSLDVR
ncbi:MAG: hypothetical protein ACXW3O_00425 [Brevundimonas sp.]